MERFSDHILKGAEITKKHKGSFSVSNEDGVIFGTCAMGAGALSAILDGNLEGKVQSENVNKAEHKFPYLYKRLKHFGVDLLPDEIREKDRPSKFVHHYSDFENTKIALIIFELNDILDWSREAIAMWLRTVEDRVIQHRREKEKEISEEENKQALQELTF